MLCRLEVILAPVKGSGIEGFLLKVGVAEKVRSGEYRAWKKGFGGW